MALTKIPASLLDTSSGINGLIYPSSDGTSGQFLKTDGSGNLTFATTNTESDVETYLDGGSSTPTFASATVSGALTVTGDLNITGDINSYNVTDLDVTDQTITLGAGQIEANSGGSGIIVDGSNASILWDETNDTFDFNKGINVDSNTLVVDGTNNRVGILNAAPDVSLDIGSSTDAIHMPVGTTAQRPSSPAAGYFRYNSDDGQFEGYTTEWGAIAGSGGGSAMETNNFTGDGSTTAFTLSSSVASEDNLIVFIEGIYQNKGDYVASGTTITFDTAPVNGRRIVVQHIKSRVAGNSTLYTSLTGDGSTTAFTLSGAPGHENNTQVFMDGVYQQKDSYIVNGTTLTFDAAPANNAEIEVMSFTQTTINQPGTNTVSVAELNLSDGTAGQFITTDGNGTISFASVGIDGIVSSANATAITIDSSENVGIGTTNPSTKLTVKNDSASTSFGDNNIITIQNANTTDNSRMGLAFTGNTNIGGGLAIVEAQSYDQSAGHTSLNFSVYSGSWHNDMMVLKAGNVGIGTNSPVTALEISTDGTDQLTLNRADATINTNNTLGGIVVSADDPTENRSGAKIGFTAADNWTTNYFPTNIIFSNDAAGTMTPRMTIDSSGNVLVGVTSPQDFTSTTTNGHTLYGGSVNAALHSRSGNAALAVQRTTNDGAIVNIFKDTTIVGNIGTFGGTTYYASNSHGFLINGTQIEPTNNTGGRLDNTLDVGSATYKFKNLYLS